MRSDLFVFDTNVLLSALFNDASPPASALRKARIDGVLLISTETAEEYFQVFSRTKFDKYETMANRLRFIERIIADAYPIAIHISVDACRDPKDNKFLSLGVNGNASCIISGDSDLLILNPFQGIPILKPVDFLHDYSIAKPWH